MLSALGRCQSHVASSLACHLIAEQTQCLGKVIAGEIAWQPYEISTSGGEHFFPDKTQEDRAGSIPFVEMAADGIEHLGAHLFQRVCLGKNRLSDSTGRVTAFWGFLDHKNEFVHERSSG